MHIDTKLYPLQIALFLLILLEMSCEVFSSRLIHWDLCVVSCTECWGSAPYEFFVVAHIGFHTFGYTMGKIGGRKKFRGSSGWNGIMQNHTIWSIFKVIMQFLLIFHLFSSQKVTQMICEMRNLYAYYACKIHKSMNMHAFSIPGKTKNLALCYSVVEQELS